MDRVEVTENPLLVRDRHAEARDWQFLRHCDEILKLRSPHQERQINRVGAPRLEAAVVHRRRDGMPYGVGDHTVDPGVAVELLYVIELAELAGAHLPRRRSLRRAPGAA